MILDVRVLLVTRLPIYFGKIKYLLITLTRTLIKNN